MVRTRFAPSPTGYLHIGGARTALFSWAFARRHGGTFVLRIEDTDVARSTPEAVQAILDGMAWLGLDCDEGPFYQMQRMPRYREVIAQMLDAGTAYHCYLSPDELDRLRADQRSRGEKPRYDGRWRPEPGKSLPTPPDGMQPVVRFRNPDQGVVAWDDAVKGRIEIANAELDDLIIARADGTPTYNFCVCVDDWDMRITHVIRGDDHVNNTPRQINILRALGAEVPTYGHLSMILGDDGQKLSKRHGAVSVMQYEIDGFLPDAVINYLARLGWSHGDDEIFSRQQLAEWFDLEHITPSAAQFNTDKLLWLNQHYLRQTPAEVLLERVSPRLEARGANLGSGPNPCDLIRLYQDRCATLNALSDALVPFFCELEIAPDLLATHLSENSLPALASLAGRLDAIDWTRERIATLVKEIVAAHGLKMPQLAMPIRVLLSGSTQAPSVDALIEACGLQFVVQRIAKAISRAGS